MIRTATLLLLLGCRQPQTQTAPVEPPKPVSTDSEREREIRRYVKRLESKNASVCLDAVDYLPYFGRDAVPALIEALRSPDSNARCLAAMTLGRIPDARAVEPLIANLDDTSTLELNVLSDDGSELHAAYDNPLPGFVQKQTRMALSAPQQGGTKANSALPPAPANSRCMLRTISWVAH